jgi:hypothetical protein
MKANEYLVLSDCVEKGVHRGWAITLDNLDIPDSVKIWLDKHGNTIKNFIDVAVIDEIDEYFTFEEPKED